MSSVIYAWGSTPEERGLIYPCDAYLSDPDSVYFRAATLFAPATVVFRWLCQMKVAPYSYDWIDNWFRSSPGRLIPGVEQLSEGQAVMHIFRLVEFEQDRHLTLVMERPGAIRIFGHIAITYLLLPVSDSACRLVVKLRIRYPTEGIWRLMRWILPWGDLLMMRKQVLTFKKLAERSWRDGGQP